MRDIKSIRGDMFAHGVPFELVQELEEAARVASDVDEVVCDVCGAKAHIFEGAPCTACHEGFMRKPVAATSEEKALAVLEDFIHASDCGPVRKEAARQSLAALRARLTETEKLAYIGEHHFPDLTWKARFAECAEQAAAIKQAVVDTVGGTVEGRPTNALNYLQRLRELLSKEASEKALRDALVAYRHDGAVPMAQAILNHGRDEILQSTRESWRKADDKVLTLLARASIDGKESK